LPQIFNLTSKGNFFGTEAEIHDSWQIKIIKKMFCGNPEKRSAQDLKMSPLKKWAKNGTVLFGSGTETGSDPKWARHT